METKFTRYTADDPFCRTTTTVKRISLSAMESETLESLAHNITVDPYTDFAGFRAFAESGWDALLPETQHELKRLATGTTDHIALVISNLPVDSDLGPTPLADGDSLDRSPGWGEVMMTALSIGIGRPISYGAERRGRIFQDIFPTKRNEKKLSSQSSASFLGFHGELAMHPTPPDLLMLHCLRPDADHMAGTLLASIDAIVDALDDADVKNLESYGYMFDLHLLHSAYTTTNGRKITIDDPRPVVPVLPNSNSPYFRFERELMTAKSREHTGSLHAAEAAAVDVSEAIFLDAGDTLILDNRRAVHARTPFQASYDGTDRWLLRSMISATAAAAAGAGHVDRPEVDLVAAWASVGATFETPGQVSA